MSHGLWFKLKKGDHVRVTGLGDVVHVVDHVDEYKHDGDWPSLRLACGNPGSLFATWISSYDTDLTHDATTCMACIANEDAPRGAEKN